MVSCDNISSDAHCLEYARDVMHIDTSNVSVTTAANSAHASLEPTAHASVESTIDYLETCSTSTFVMHAQVDNISSLCNVHSDSTTINRIQLMGEIQGSDIENAKALLKIRDLKQFQISCLAAIKQNEDVIIVQPTGSGKSVYFTLPALLSPGKISLVIEPVVAIIINQVETLQCKGINAVALGRAAGTNKSANFRRVFQSSSNAPCLVFCTPEYLFGTPSAINYMGTSGQFLSFVEKKEIFCMVTIDEAHKVFDRMPNYRPEFDAMKQLKELQCPIVAMSATLTDLQISILKQEYLRSGDCLVLTSEVHRDNVKISMQ